MIPKGKGTKYATSCFRSEKGRKAVGKKEKVILLRDIFRENLVGVEQWPGQLWIQDGVTARTTAGVISAQINNFQFTSVGEKPSVRLQITNLDLLRGEDCQTMCRSTRV